MCFDLRFTSFTFQNEDIMTREKHSRRLETSVVTMDAQMLLILITLISLGACMESGSGENPQGSSE
jgi:hypothetical protein